MEHDSLQRTLAPTGALDLTSVGPLMADLKRACEEKATCLTLDLRGVTLIDSSGIRLLIEAVRLCEAAGTQFDVIPSPRHESLFAVKGLHDFIPWREPHTSQAGVSEPSKTTNG